MFLLSPEEKGASIPCQLPLSTSLAMVKIKTSMKNMVVLHAFPTFPRLIHCIHISRRYLVVELKEQVHIRETLDKEQTSISIVHPEETVRIKLRIGSDDSA